MQTDLILQNQGIAITAFFLVSAIFTGLAYLVRKRGYEPDLTIDILALVPAVFGVWGLFNELAVTRNLNHNFRVLTDRFVTETALKQSSADISKLEVLATDIKMALSPCLGLPLPHSADLEHLCYRAFNPFSGIFADQRLDLARTEGIELVRVIGSADILKLQAFLWFLWREGYLNENPNGYREFLQDGVFLNLEEHDKHVSTLGSIDPLREIDDEDPLFLVLIMLAIALEISKTASRVIYNW